MLLDQLPLLSPPEEGESGLGYCLRSVRRNRCSLHWLRRAAGIGERTLITAANAAKLAGLIGCDAAWLSHALPAHDHTQPRPYWRYFGHSLLAQNELRVRSPQVCPRCVHIEGVCRREWDISIVTACHRHQCHLVDRCSRCLGRLRWDRLDVGVCHCGQVIKSAETSEVPESVLSLVSLVDARMSGVTPRGAAWNAAGLPLFVRELSLSGLLTVICAFGIKKSPHDRAHSSQSTRALSSAEWHSLVIRALARFRELDWLEDQVVGELRFAVSEAALLGLLRTPPQPSDAHAARILLTGILGKGGKLSLGETAQLELFG